MGMLPDSRQVDLHLHYGEGVAKAYSWPATKRQIGVLVIWLSMLWVETFGLKGKWFGKISRVTMQRPWRKKDQTVLRQCVAGESDGRGGLTRQYGRDRQQAHRFFDDPVDVMQVVGRFQGDRLAIQGHLQRSEQAYRQTGHVLCLRCQRGSQYNRLLHYTRSVAKVQPRCYPLESLGPVSLPNVFLTLIGYHALTKLKGKS